MGVDTDPFPTTTVGMVDAHLPRDKGKGKIEFLSARYIPRKGIQPRLQIDLFSNSPPRDSVGPAIIESMSSLKVEIVPARHVLTKGFQPRLKIDLFSNSPPRDTVGPAIVESMISFGAEEAIEAATLCTQCKADVPVKPKARPHQTEIPRVRSVSTTLQRKPSSSLRNTVLSRLGPYEVKSSSARRRLNFDTPFYNEEYYSCNSSGSSSSANRRTFKPLNLKTSDGILITRPRVCTPRYPNHRSVDVKESIA